MGREDALEEKKKAGVVKAAQLHLETRNGFIITQLFLVL